MCSIFFVFLMKLISYFRPQKLAALFSTRSHKVDAVKVNVVYQFACTEVGCQASYIGHATCTLNKRSSQHKYSSSAIYKHFANDHALSIVPDAYINNFSILNFFSDHEELRIAEAILISKKNPPSLT